MANRKQAKTSVPQTDLTGFQNPSGLNAPRDLPDGWKWARLGELEDANQVWMRNGFPCGTNNEQDRGIPQLRPMNVDNSGQIDFALVKYIETGKDVSGYSLKDNDVIFNNTNSRELVGKTAVWHEQGRRYVLSNHMTVLRFASNAIVDPHYLARRFHFLWLNGYFEKIRRQHVNQASISLERLREIEIPLPPLPEQRAIAHVLRTVQHARAARQRKLTLERERKAALMEHLFTRGTRGEPRKQTEIGEMPESWRVVELREVCEFLQYGTSKQCDGDVSGIPVLRIPNIIGGKVDVTELKFIKMTAQEANQLRLVKGDLIFVRTNGRREYLGRCAVYEDEFPIALFASYLIRARIKPDTIIPQFVKMYAETGRGRGFLSGKASGAADGKFNINTQTIRSVLVPTPALQEQQVIVQALQSCDAKIAALEREAQVLDELFRAMLDELMTGKLRVKE